jgi:hypothetical protein
MIYEQMSALASKKFAIVGCNVSAHMALKALETRFPDAEIKWIVASKDLSIDEEPDTCLCLPEQLYPSLALDTPDTPTDLQWHLHFNHHEHELLSDFSSLEPRRPNSLKIPFALRRKIESPRPVERSHPSTLDRRQRNRVGLDRRRRHFYRRAKVVEVGTIFQKEFAQSASA